MTRMQSSSDRAARRTQINTNSKNGIAYTGFLCRFNVSALIKGEQGLVG
ncbi:hypothetical protein [Polaromonas sp. CG9_12]|nr:hypothetical protein [Polaromonas sp. CG9_12]